MPRPGKKKRGKAKSAKKAPGGDAVRKTKDVERSWEYWAFGGADILLSSNVGASNIRCKHTQARVPESNHPVALLMSSFDDETFTPGYTIQSLITAMHRGHEAVWSNAEHRQFAIDLFVRIGTNMILKQSNDVIEMTAAAACMLEHYDGNISSTYISADPKLRDLTEGAVKGGTTIRPARDVIRFFHKRTTCKCLFGFGG